MVGSGPNGLAAAITLAQAGVKTVLREAQPTVGGGLRCDELTLPGFVHDACSAVYAVALTSPFFTSLPLDRFGLEWIQPPVPLAHPLDDGSAVLLERSLDATALNLGPGGRAWVRLRQTRRQTITPAGDLRGAWAPRRQGTGALRRQRGALVPRAG